VYAIDPIPDPAQIASDAAARFVRDFHARYPGEVLDGYGANAYDAAMALIAAIKRLIQQGQAVTRESVLEQVQTIQTEGAPPARSPSTPTATALTEHSVSTRRRMAVGFG
jgi:hypothetical protein